MSDYQNIVVAVDGSKEAEFALHKAIGLAKHGEDTTLTIVKVIDTFTIANNEIPLMEQEQKQSEELVNNYRTLAQSHGVRHVEALVKEGSPKKVITEEVAPAVSADLIACGATGLKGVEQFFLGSVSEAIVIHAKCDVLVVRKDEQVND